MLAKYKFISKRKITLLFIILHLCLQSFRQKMSNSITMRIVIQYRIQPQPIIYYRIIILKKVMYKFWKPMNTYWSYLVGKTFLNKRLLSAVYIYFRCRGLFKSLLVVLHALTIAVQEEYQLFSCTNEFSWSSFYIRDTRTKRVHLYFTVNESGKTNETRKTREN